MQTLDANDAWPDYIIQGAYSGSYPLTADPNLLANATARGVNVIAIIDIHNDVSGAQSRPVDYIAVTKRYEELATFLGATTRIRHNTITLLLTIIPLFTFIPGHVRSRQIVPKHVNSRQMTANDGKSWRMTANHGK